MSLVVNGNTRLVHQGLPVNRSRSILLAVLFNLLANQRSVKLDGNTVMGLDLRLASLDILGFISLVHQALNVLRDGVLLNIIFGVLFPAHWNIEG